MPVMRGTSTPVGIRPPIGSQSSQAPNTSSSIRPSQKIGIETPKSVAVIRTLSHRPPGRVDATTPTGTPTTIAMSRAARASCSVTGKALNTSASAESLLRSDVPKSPWATWATKSRYCTTTG